MNLLELMTALAISNLAAPIDSGDVATADAQIQVQARAREIRVTKLRSKSYSAGFVPQNQNAAGLALIDHAFVNGRRVSLNWQLRARSIDRMTRRLTFRYECQSPRLDLTSIWQGSGGPGPVNHILTLTNRHNVAVTLPRQSSLSLAIRVPQDHRMECWWVEKTAGFPTSAGTHTDLVHPGYAQRLLSTPYSEDGQRDPIPWCCLHDGTARRGVYLGVAFSGRVSLDLAASQVGQMSVDAGIAAEAPGDPIYTTVLKPGETFSAPPTFVGCYQGTVDDGANQLRTWLREKVCQPILDENYPLLTLNSWGSGMAIGAPLAKAMSEKAADLGLEMFHIDAGWFRQVGDWRSNPDKFPSGLRAVSDDVHRLGLKFGLWTGWTQAGIADEFPDPSAILSAFSSSRRDWIAEPRKPDWKPEDFIGTTVCLSVPATQDWCLHLLDRLVNEFRVDMLEHDQRIVVENCVHDDHPHSRAHSDIAYRAALGYYSVYDRLRKLHPKLMFEDCVNGGRMVDFGVLSRASYISISDTYTPMENRQAFYDNAFAIPPAMCECYVSDREPVHSIGEFISMLRSGMMGWFTLMQNPVTWTPEQSAAAKIQFQIYKTRLRPLIRNGNLFHASGRPDGLQWDGIQYASQDLSSAVLFAFRGTQCPSTHRFHLLGLDPHATYTVEFEDGSQSKALISGAALMTDGIDVQLQDPKTSQLVFASRH